MPIVYLWHKSHDMMTSSNGNVFRVTGPLCGEFTGPGEFPTQRPVTRSFDVFFDLRLNKRLSKQPWGWWFETLSGPLWRQSNDAPVPYSKMCHYVTEICTCVHISITKWRIIGHLPKALWDLWGRFIIMLCLLSVGGTTLGNTTTRGMVWDTRKQIYWLRKIVTQMLC